MKLTSAAFTSDRLQLSWWDLFKLALGIELTTDGLRVRRGKMKP